MTSASDEDFVAFVRTPRHGCCGPPGSSAGTRPGRGAGPGRPREGLSQVATDRPRCGHGIRPQGAPQPAHRHPPAPLPRGPHRRDARAGGGTSGPGRGHRLPRPGPRHPAAAGASGRRPALLRRRLRAGGRRRPSGSASAPSRAAPLGVSPSCARPSSRRESTMADDITTLFHEAATPTMAVDPYAVLAGGRRRRRRRTLAVGAAAAVTATVAVAVTAACLGGSDLADPLPADRTDTPPPRSPPRSTSATLLDNTGTPIPGPLDVRRGARPLAQCHGNLGYYTVGPDREADAHAARSVRLPAGLGATTGGPPSVTWGTGSAAPHVVIGVMPATATQWILVSPGCGERVPQRPGRPARRHGPAGLRLRSTTTATDAGDSHRPRLARRAGSGLGPERAACRRRGSAAATSASSTPGSPCGASFGDWQHVGAHPPGEPVGRPCRCPATTRTARSGYVGLVPLGATRPGPPTFAPGCTRPGRRRRWSPAGDGAPRLPLCELPAGPADRARTGHARLTVRARREDRSPPSGVSHAPVRRPGARTRRTRHTAWDGRPAQLVGRLAPGPVLVGLGDRAAGLLAAARLEVALPWAP